MGIGGDGKGHENHVHTSDSKELLDCAESDQGDDRDDTTRGAGSVKSVTDKVAEFRPDRGQDNEAQRNGDEHGEERRCNGLEQLRDMLLEELVDVAHDPNREQHRDDTGLVVDHRNADAEHGQRLASAHESQEIRLKKDAAEQHAEHRADVELLSGDIADVDRQEAEAGVVDAIEQDVEVVRLVEKAEECRAEDDLDGLEETADHDDRHARNDRAGEVVEDRSTDSLECEGLLLAIKVLIDGRGSLKIREGDDLAVDLGNPLTDDDHVLGASAGDTDNAVDLLDLVIVWDGVVLEVEAQARHAVRNVLDVVGTADRIEHCLSKLPVICHNLPFHGLNPLPRRSRAGPLIEKVVVRNRRRAAI